MSDSSGSDKPSPPYAKYAFSNVYNLTLLSGVASAAVLTGNWWLGIAGAGVETLWMLFAPDSRLLRRFWFDKRFESERQRAREAEMDGRVATLPTALSRRCVALVQKQHEIQRLAAENPSFTIELLSGELKKLDDLVRCFSELAVNGARYDTYLATVDLDLIERDLTHYRAALDDVDKSEVAADKRVLAQKNIAILSKRKEKFAEIRRDAASTAGQLDLIENTFRLLADQIVTMRTPQELSGQLDELLDGVEAVRQTARDTDKLLQAVER